MMRMNAKTLVFALLILIGGSAAEKKSVKIDAPEDELFWARELQDTSLSVVPTLPPTLPPVPPATLAPTTPPLPPPVPPATLAPTTPPLPPPVSLPTLAPTTLPPPLPACTIIATIACSVGEGIECSSNQAPPDRCLQDSLYTYTFQNTGTAQLTIIEAMSVITGREPFNLIGFVNPRTLEAGQAVVVFQQQSVDYCSTTPITNTVIVKADPGGCFDETTLEFLPSRRRALRSN